MSSVTYATSGDKCPVSRSEFDNVRLNHANLASTGCTRNFCQAGRAVHTDEPRVGENRTLQTVEQEAKDFLQELNREAFYDSEAAFLQRLEQVLTEIKVGATKGVVRETQTVATIGGTWKQTSRELEFGIRRAWRNARKCILRSHSEELKLLDLRTIDSSIKMAAELISGLQRAFNNGNIQPTVFVFPPRTSNGRGPMILNNQVLQFAGYKTDDGSVIGDPASVELTKTIIELGWSPPAVKSRWDVLPLVTMADGDRPCIAEIPSNLRQLVNIRHPYLASEFEKLDLKWVPFPALTRLGFDIGGVQYTAAPFIGWFMDAEIGVRNLADPFRYNALPEIVEALGLLKGRLVDGLEEFEDLPEYEKLAMLSRAQSELNYAVHWSFLQAKVMMTDSLTASMKWSQYDDAFREKHGYRLPADPYWLAPPQGSIIPLWHRGGAPNYQPKPMICKHVQDPIKAWNREKHRWPSDMLPLQYKDTACEPGVVTVQRIPMTPVVDMVQLKKPRRSECIISLVKTVGQISCLPQNTCRSIAIYFCSAGTIAEKLAAKIHKWTKNLTKTLPNISLALHIRPLNSMKILDLDPNAIVLLVISSTGEGEVPPNGRMALAHLSNGTSLEQSSNCRKGFRFAIYGNGDSRYSNTFNGAAEQFNVALRTVGGIPVAGGLFKGDIAVEPMPLRALKGWFAKLEPTFAEPMDLVLERTCPNIPRKYDRAHPVMVDVTSVDDAVQPYEDHQVQLLSTLDKATLASVHPEVLDSAPQSRLLSLNVCNEPFEEMSCIQLLPLNAEHKVSRALSALCVEGSALMNIEINGACPTFSRFFTEIVDLELHFSQLNWLNEVSASTHQSLTEEITNKLSTLEVLERLHAHISQPQTPSMLRTICLSMPLLRTRTYSIASSNHYLARSNRSPPPSTPIRQLDILIKTLPTGRFSSTFLSDHPFPSPLKYRIVDSLCGPLLRKHHLSPFFIIATGAGFAPVRCLLQWRIAAAIASGRTHPPLRRGISLFLGLKECDLELIMKVLNEALALDLIDVLNVVVSNPEKRRVYEELPRYAPLVRDKVLRRRGFVFVCTGKVAADVTRETIGDVLGGSAKGLLGDRYIEEVY